MGPESEHKSSGYPNFVRAYLKFRRYQSQLGDFNEFYTRRYRAFCTILERDLAEPPVENEAASDLAALFSGFDSVTQFCLRISTPFSGYYEAPARLVFLADPYEIRFKALAAEQESLSIDLLCGLAEAIWGACERCVDQDELDRLGVSSSQEPDPFDYF